MQKCAKNTSRTSHLFTCFGGVVRRLVGVDEVGRGAWAGPLLVCAARLKKGKRFPKGLTDSKLLSKKQREELYPKIMDACEIGEGWVSADIIDQLGLTNALKNACLLAAMQLGADFDDAILLDGTVNFFEGSHYTKVEIKAKADLTDEIVSSASIVAKVTRDALMAKYDEDYPGYGFATHVGYGTKQHREAIAQNGITLLHRKSFRPIKKLGW